MDLPVKGPLKILDAIEVLIALPAIVCVCYRGDIIAVNRHARAAFGDRPLAGIVGRPFTDFLSQDYQAFGTEFLDLVREEKDGLQVKLAPRLGSVTDMELHCVVDDMAPAEICVLYGNDISDTVRNSKDLQKGEARYRTMLSGATAMTCEIRDGMIVEINPAGQSLLRVLDWHAYEGRPFSTLFHGEYRDLMDSELQSLCDEKTPLPVRMLRSDGTICDVEMTVASLDGKIRNHLLAQMHDISIQNTALRDLRRMNDDLKQQLLRVQEQQEMLQAANAKLARVSKLEAIGTFAFGIAHEMNTPIQTLTANLDFLQSSMAELDELIDQYSGIAPDDETAGGAAEALKRLHEKVKEKQIGHILEDAPKAIEDSKSGVSHISLVVKAMRDFTNRQETDASRFDLNTFVAEEVASLRRGWGSGVDLEYEPTGAAIHLVADRAELGRALRNIVDNAIWAIRDAGKDRGRIAVATRCKAGRAFIEIADDGIGMNRETLKKAFDPFFTTREVGRGIGQGLTIAHHIVRERSGGEIEISSTPGVGTVVTISLPTEQPEAIEIDPRSDTDVDTAPSRTTV